MKRFVCLFLITIISQLFIYSQGIVISGKLVDSDSGNAVEYGTVRLLSLPDSALVVGGVSSADGSFKLQTETKGSFLLKISCIGYKTQDIPLQYSRLSVNMGIIKLSSDAIMLDEAVVTAEAPPVKVEEDTVAYNASAYKVSEGAVWS